MLNRKKLFLLIVTLMVLLQRQLPPSMRLILPSRTPGCFRMRLRPAMWMVKIIRMLHIPSIVRSAMA